MKYNLLYGAKRLAHHKSSQCQVLIHDNGVIDFISYRTLVIRATPCSDYKFTGTEVIIQPVAVPWDNCYVLECTGTYSPTTRKQMGWFLAEYFGDVSYYNMKEIIGEDAVVMAANKSAKYW